MNLIKLFRNKNLSVLLALTVLFASCTPNVSEESNNAEYSDIAAKYKGIRTKSIKVKKIVKETKSVKFAAKTGNFNITQDIIDDYATQLGFGEGVISAEEVEKIMVENNKMLNNGFENFIESQNLSDFTKTKMLELADGQLLSSADLVEFNYLPPAEKEMIALSNEFNKESQEFYGKNYHGKIEDEGFYSGAVGAIVIGLIGGSIGFFGLGFFVGLAVHGYATK